MPGTVLSTRNTEVIKTRSFYKELAECKLASGKFYKENKTW